MIPFILGALGLIAYGLSEKETKEKSSKKSYSKGLPAKIKWDKKNNIYGKSVGNKFLKISKKEFDSLYNDAHDGYYYQANAQLKGGVMTYTLRSIHSKTKMAKGGGVGGFKKGDLVIQKYDLRNRKGYEIIEKVVGFDGDMLIIESASKKIGRSKSRGRVMPKDVVKYNKMAKGGSLNSEIDALYGKSGLINDDFDWKNKLIEMLQDNSIEAYQIYQKLTAKQKKDVLQELFEMDNDMGSYGDDDIETSKENLSILLNDAKKGKKY